MAYMWVLTFSHGDCDRDEILLGVFSSLEGAQRAVDSAYDPCDAPDWHIAAAPYRTGHFRTPRSDAIAERPLRGEYVIECIEIDAVRPDYPLPPLTAQEEQSFSAYDGLVAKLWGPLLTSSMKANTTLSTAIAVDTLHLPVQREEGYHDDAVISSALAQQTNAEPVKDVYDGGS